MGEINRTTGDTPGVIEVPLVCQGEQKTIGALRLTAGRAVLTPELVAGAFQPIDPSYEFPRPAGIRGAVLKCPRCGSPVLVRGTIRPPERGPDDNSPRRPQRPGAAKAAPINRTREQARTEALAAAEARTRAGVGADGKHAMQTRGRETAVSGSPGMNDRDASPITLGSTALELR